MVVDDCSVGNGVRGIVVRHRARTGRSLIDEGSVGDGNCYRSSFVNHESCRHEVAVTVVVTSPELGNLADAAGDRIVVTFSARLGVV